MAIAPSTLLQKAIRILKPIILTGDQNLNRDESIVMAMEIVEDKRSDIESIVMAMEIVEDITSSEIESIVMAMEIVDDDIQSDIESIIMAMEITEEGS